MNNENHFSGLDINCCGILLNRAARTAEAAGLMLD